MTLLTASMKSLSVATLRRERMANIPASVQTLCISAPTTKEAGGCQEKQEDCARPCFNNPMQFTGRLGVHA